MMTKGSGPSFMTILSLLLIGVVAEEASAVASLTKPYMFSHFGHDPLNKAPSSPGLYGPLSTGAKSAVKRAPGSPPGSLSNDT